MRGMGAALLAVALTAAPAVLSPARAQDAPVRLAPPQPLSPAPGTGERPAAQDPAAQDPEGQGPAPGTGTESPGIRVDALGAIDLNSVGLLDAGAGGFGVAMWRGTPRVLVERLLPSLPAASKSPTARELTRRLLLSAAETPVGPDRKGGPSLLALRLDRLLAQGDVVSAQALLRVVPSRVEEEAIGRARAEVAFLLNDNAGACAEVRARLDSHLTAFWRKGQVFCQLLAGETAGAAIGADLLREQGVEDAPFFALARILGGEKGVAVGALETPGPLHVAMMRAARVQVPPAVASDGAAMVLRTVALSPNADLDTRLEAAERAEAAGALEATALRQLYLSVNFPPDDVAGALTAAETLSGPRGRALLYRAAHGQSVASAQAEIVARALALARAQGRLGTAIRVFLPILSGIEPRGDLAWFAPEAGAALYYAGALDDAAPWHELAKVDPGAARSGGGPTLPAPALPSEVALWPFAALAALPVTREGELPGGTPPGDRLALVDNRADGGADDGTVITAALAAPSPAADGFDETAFDRWWAAAAVLGEEVRAARAARLLTLMEALGARVGDGAWSRLVTAQGGSATLPPVGLMKGMARAAEVGRIGETVLMALVALGGEAPGAVDARVLGPVVRALNAVGLTDAARRLAIEAVFDART